MKPLLSSILGGVVVCVARDVVVLGSGVGAGGGGEEGGRASLEVGGEAVDGVVVELQGLGAGMTIMGGDDGASGVEAGAVERVMRRVWVLAHDVELAGGCELGPYQYPPLGVLAGAVAELG